MTDPNKAISDWSLNYNLGCAVMHILNSQKTGRNSDLRRAIDYLQEEIKFNEQKELERFKNFADVLTDKIIKVSED